MTEIVTQLQSLQRQRSVVMKSRIMQANRLQSIIAGTLGYHNGMTEKERTRKYAEATAVIKGVDAGTTKHPMQAVIRSTLIGISAFEEHQDGIEKEMVKLARKLPVAAWVKKPEQRGFGLPSLAVIIGECGDLNNYANPAKLWRRMGCAPWTFDGQTHMGATWRAGKEGKLPSSEWESFGYAPRRRSIAFLIGEGIVKQNRLAGDGASETEIALADQGENGTGNGEGVIETEAGHAAPGPYLARYLEAKASAKVSHPDWTPLRCHRHGMLLATKRLLRELWIQWREVP